ncbi:MAG: hypothetical protein LUI06_10070 [Ruminococcus sp.]|nr:hypothetical protein [Ruminococcus sp.]
MIKGINKQIIEIKCTNDEYFEKVLLFVRADKADLPRGVLNKGAENYCGRFLPNSVNKSHTGIKTALLCIILAGVLAVIAYLIMCL